jgi:hypothetical protein
MSQSERINTCYEFYRSKHALDLSKNKDLKTDEKYIDEGIKWAATVLSLGGEMPLTDEEMAEFKKMVLADAGFFQQESMGLVSSYNQVDWWTDTLNDKSFERQYWTRYKNYLIEDKHFSIESINFLENKTLKNITNFLGDPKSQVPFNRRGLVIGDVQSGKTATYVGLICNAVDAGYRVIILLAGTIENLRRQTQKRVEEGFIGYDSKNNKRVGVGILDPTGPTPQSITSRDRDIVGSADQNTIMGSIGNGTPTVFIIKKNVSVMEKLYQGLKNTYNLSTTQKMTFPLIMIDDEADNASINTNSDDKDPTKINQKIRQLLDLFSRATYIGFTATPFANVFIQPDTNDEMLGDDLFPRDFIYPIKSPSTYFGPHSVFAHKSKYVVPLDDYDELFFPMKHLKTWNGDHLFRSLETSIIAFLLANAVRDLKGDITEHRSMLVNVSRFIAVQYRISDIVQGLLNKYINATQQNLCKTFEEYKNNVLIGNLIHTWNDLYSKDEPHITWNQVAATLYDSIRNIKVIVVNSAQKDKLNYDSYKEGLRVIAIGGLALSRGLTLEGLIISYFYRNTSTYDVLMQMGRWFGYRPNYEELCRVWITQKSAEWYSEISEATDELKDDIERMVRLKQTPKDFGIRVRNVSEELGITAPNKMRNAHLSSRRLCYYGELFETPYLSENVDQNQQNITSVDLLISELPAPDKGIRIPFFRSIPKVLVAKLLLSLSIDTVNINFDCKQIAKFITDSKDPAIDLFDVAFIGGDHDSDPMKIGNLAEVSPIERSFDIHNGFIRLGGSSVRLGSKTDSAWGLSDEDKSLAENKDAFDKEQSRINGKQYLIEGRHPILLIYYIHLIPDNKNGDSLDSMRQNRIANELNKEPDSLLVGFGIGFPRTSNQDLIKETTDYFVNDKCSYFEKFHNELESNLEDAQDEIDDLDDPIKEEVKQ